MPFLSDQQTLSDLGVQGKYKVGSLFNLFNRVRTKGGEKLLEDLFREPLSKAEAINRRAEKMKYIQQLELSIPIDTDNAQAAGDYLAESQAAGIMGSLISTAGEKLQQTVYNSDHVDLRRKHVQAIRHLVSVGRDVLGQFSDGKTEHPCHAEHQQLETLLEGLDIPSIRRGQPVSMSKMIRCRYLIEHRHRQALEELLELLYTLDVWAAVASVARERQLTYPKAFEAGQTEALIQAENLKHPTLSGAVGNDLTLTRRQNLMFLTGANMAGKSTLMKAMGTSFYLAHMGFPVAADTMSFTVLDGIYSSINVKDQISKGWSHFYAEVMRMKQIAEQLTKGNRLFVLFDEMYKSTNVKDAYDATLAISRKLAQYNQCCFVVSTHIIEVGEDLRENDNVMFRYMPTVMNESVPQYTYDMTEGITDDRQGMIIIENEGILDMLE